MPDLGSRRGAVNMAVLTMILAFLAIGGFLYWLNVSAVGTEGPVVTSAADDPYATALAVSLAEIQASATRYQGQLIRVSNVAVVSRLGTQAFWTQLPNEQPFLVHFDSALVAGGAAVTSGQTARSVVGRIHVMGDSVLNAWEAGGAFTDPVQRIEAEFATNFLEAVRVEGAAMAPPPAPPGEGGN